MDKRTVGLVEEMSECFLDSDRPLDARWFFARELKGDDVRALSRVVGEVPVGLAHAPRYVQDIV